MKAFSFKSNTSVIRVLKEPVIKKKKLNFDRMLYFIIIAICLVLLIRYIFVNTAIVKANGQVLMHKVDVNFTHDIRLLSFFTNEGDTICKDQPLFRYIEDQFDNYSTAILSGFENDQNRDKKSLDLEFRIKGLRLQIAALKQQLGLLLKEKKRISDLVLLDVYTMEKLSALVNQITALEHQIRLEQNNLALLYEQKKLFGEWFHTNDLSFGSGSNVMQTNYQAPLDGIIGQIAVVENETCYRTESVLTIHDPNRVFVKAYFELEEISNVRIDDEVIVKFPDKTKSKGIVKKYYISTYALPEEFQKTYEPTERSVVIEIEPLNDTEKQIWTQYHKLNIVVEKYRYEL